MVKKLATSKDSLEASNSNACHSQVQYKFYFRLLKYSFQVLYIDIVHDDDAEWQAVCAISNENYLVTRLNIFCIMWRVKY